MCDDELPYYSIHEIYSGFFLLCKRNDLFNNRIYTKFYHVNIFRLITIRKMSKINF